MYSMLYILIFSMYLDKVDICLLLKPSCGFVALYHDPYCGCELNKRHLRHLCSSFVVMSFLVASSCFPSTLSPFMCNH